MATRGPIAARTVLPYRREYYCETVGGSAGSGSSGPGASGSGAADSVAAGSPLGLVGREVANRQWLEALLKHGKSKSLGFLLYQDSDQASLEATLAQHAPPEKTIRMGPLRNARQWLGHGVPRVVWEPQPPSSRWTWLRHQHAKDKFAVCGITHALCSPAAIGALRDLVMSPVEPYDRLICTSSAVAATADAIQSHWMVVASASTCASAESAPTSPRERLRFKTIPLGVDVDHHSPATQDAQLAARRHFGIDDDANVVLFVGRLSHHAKSNPLPLFAACQRSQQITGKPITLVMAGWFANASVREAYVREAARVAPSVKVGFIDATKPENRDRVWEVADLFVSLADSVQETFGLTVVEAMSRQLPVIASDWNGYRESVVDGKTGYLIPTAMVRGVGDDTMNAMMRGDLSYDHFLARIGQGIAVDSHAVTDRLVLLFQDSDLRRAMGRAGRLHVEAKFTWKHVIAATEELWDQQRLQISRYRAPKHEAASPEVSDSGVERVPAAVGLTPNSSLERLFAKYPSRWIDSETAFQLGGQLFGGLDDLLTSPLANHSGAGRLSPPESQMLLASLSSEETVTPKTIAALSVELQSASRDAVTTEMLAAETVAWAVKFDLLKPAEPVGLFCSDDRQDSTTVSKSSSDRITFSTTCMGRLEHLKQTLPAMVAQPNCHVVVVDYSCPDGAGDWVQENYKSSEVTVVRVPDRAQFDRSEAKNAGIMASPTDWVCLVDADVILAPEFAEHLRQRMRPGQFLRSASILEGTGGTFLAEKSSFVKAEMHDCVYQGWGEEDDDLLDSLQFHGIRGDVYDDCWVTHLEHGDELRTKFHKWDDRRISHMVNRIYRSAKWDMARMSQDVPPVSVREELFANISEQVRRLVREQADVDVVIDTGEMNWVPLSARCSRQLVYRIKPDERINPGTYAKQSDLPGEAI